MRIPRLQLVEIEDLPWCPALIRNYATDYLHAMETRLDLMTPVLPLLLLTIASSGATQVVDLCSGGGGPVLALYEGLLTSGVRIGFTLTDKYPNLEAFTRLAALHPDLRFISAPVDATALPPNLPGMRTLFNAFHHFAPTQARAMLADAAEARQPIAIFEIPERGLLMFLVVMLTPALVLLVTPFIRPFRWSRLLWTYLIPLVPFLCWWDGMVSMCRAYTVDEMRALTTGLGGHQWTIAQASIRGSLGHITYLIGIPIRG